MIFYKFFMGDYQRDTNRLSFVEDAAYRRLLDEYYATEEMLPLDHDELYTATRAVREPEQKAVDKILERYFIKETGGYRHNRAEQEIEAYHAKSDQARKAAHAQTPCNR